MVDAAGPALGRLASHREARNAGNGRCGLAAQVAELACLGDSWDYVLVPVSSQRRLRVTCPAEHVLEREQRVWLEIDHALVVAIPE